jgi:hypothetical protein
MELLSESVRTPQKSILRDTQPLMSHYWKRAGLDSATRESTITVFATWELSFQQFQEWEVNCQHYSDLLRLLNRCLGAIP